MFYREHWAFSYDSPTNTITFVKNGVEVFGPSALSGQFSGTNTDILLMKCKSDQYSNGALDEFRLWIGIALRPLDIARSAILFLIFLFPLFFSFTAFFKYHLVVFCSHIVLLWIFLTNFISFPSFLDGSLVQSRHRIPTTVT